MAQFEVPQNIELESKIVGPFTIRQFGFVAAPFLICFFLFFVLTFGFWIVITIILMSAGLSFSFIKIEGRPLYVIAALGLKFLWQPKLYLWQRPHVEEVINAPVAHKTSSEGKRNVLGSALGSLSSVGKLWQDITTRKTPIPKREKTVPRPRVGDIKEQYQVFKRITGEKDIARRIDYR